MILDPRLVIKISDFGFTAFWQVYPIFEFKLLKLHWFEEYINFKNKNGKFVGHKRKDDFHRLRVDN